MIKIECTGDFTSTQKFLSKMSKMSISNILNKYGQIGVDALASATPKDTGETSGSWGYKITTGKNTSTITWTNNNIVDGIPIAVLIQYGHGTKNGGYVSGVDFINPAMKDVFNNIANAVWMEVVKS